MSYQPRKYQSRKYQSRKQPVYAAKPKRYRPANPRPKRKSKYAPVYRSIGTLMPFAGGAIGSSLGGPAGAALGTSLGKVGQNILTGFGDYNIHKNSIIKGEVPQVSNSMKPGSGTLITFKEYIGDVISSATANTFNVDSFQIKPTDSKTFPWLSQIASNYQEWQAHGIVFEFKSSSGDALNSTNTSLGSVLMATNYNAAMDEWDNRSAMENTEYANSIKPSESCIHAIESARSASVISNLYTNDADGHSDIRLSSLGKFQISTSGFQGTSVNCGSLYVSYQIELLKPQVYDGLGEDVGILWLSNTNSVADATPLGATGWERHPTSNMNTIVPTSTVLTLPYSSVTKSYMVSFYWNGASTALVQLPSFVASGGATRIDNVYRVSTGPTADFARSEDLVTSTEMLFQACYSVIGGSHAAVITLGTGGTLMSASCSVDVKIVEIPNSFISSAGTVTDWLPEQ